VGKQTVELLGWQPEPPLEMILARCLVESPFAIFFFRWQIIVGIGLILAFIFLVLGFGCIHAKAHLLAGADVTLLFLNTFSRLFFLLAPIIDKVLLKFVLRFAALLLVTRLLLMATCIFIVGVPFFIASFGVGDGLTCVGWIFLLLGNFVKLALFYWRLTLALYLEAGKIRDRLHSYVTTIGLLRL